MTIDRLSFRRIGVPIEFERREDHCAISVAQFEVASHRRNTTQRSLGAMGAKLGIPLYVEGGFQEFELIHPLGVPVPTPDKKTAAIKEPSGSSETGPATSSPEEPPAAGLSLSMSTPEVVVAADPMQQGPLLAAAPGAGIARGALEDLVRSGPDLMRVDGAIIPWATTASPKPTPKAPESVQPLRISRVRDETLLRTETARYRAPNVDQARGISVGAIVIVEKGEQRHFLLARASALQLQGDIFDTIEVDPEADP